MRSQQIVSLQWMVDIKVRWYIVKPSRCFYTTWQALNKNLWFVLYVNITTWQYWEVKGLKEREWVSSIAWLCICNVAPGAARAAGGETSSSPPPASPGRESPPTQTSDEWHKMEEIQKWMDGEYLILIQFHMNSSIIINFDMIEKYLIVLPMTCTY